MIFNDYDFAILAGPAESVACNLLRSTNY